MDIEREEFTDKEKYWLSVIEDAEIKLESYQNKQLIDKSDKRNIQITSKYIEFLYKILKYENLKDPNTNDFLKCKKLVKINKNIPTKELDLYGYNYFIFNGLYVVCDVIFANKDICKKFFNNPTSPKSLYGIPDDVFLGSIKYITFSDTKKEYGVFLARSSFTDRYIQYNSQWSYPIF